MATEPQKRIAEQGDFDCGLLTVTSSPHLRDSMSTQRIMQEVCLALAPAGIAAIILFGMNAALLIVAAVATAVIAEYAWQKLNKQFLLT